MTPVKCLCVKPPHLTSWVSRSDELLILFLLLPLYQSNELLILSFYAHFLLWLCMPLLHFLNTPVYTALGRAQAHPSSPVQPCPSVPKQLLVCPHGGYLTEKHDTALICTLQWKEHCQGCDSPSQHLLHAGTAVPSCPPLGVILQPRVFLAPTTVHHKRNLPAFWDLHSIVAGEKLLSALAWFVSQQ